MRWRAPIVVLLGLLLPLPLAWMLYTTASGGAEHGSPGAGTVPMLSLEERRGLLTYERQCQSGEDCDPPLECFFNPRNKERYCTDSTCMTNSHCPKGFVCRTAMLGREGPSIRLCALEGIRKEGEACDTLPRSPKEGCEPGLFCQGWCGRPCQRDEPASCPEGFFCAEGTHGLSCLPSCEGRACPEGQRCLSLGRRGVSVCASVHGEDCQSSPCPDERRCLVDYVPHRPGEVWMRCAARCGGDAPLCPEGLVCHLFRCRQPCEPENPEVCGPHHRCHRNTDSEPWVCRPDY
jgi:hypothetical protein